MRPEQEQALAYLHRKGTLATLPEIRARLHGAFADTERFVATVGESDARARPAPEKWSIQEIVDHLVETHRACLRELSQLLRGERPEHGPVPAGLQSHAPLHRSWNDLIAELRALHGEISTMLAAVPEAFATEARAPVVMVVPITDPEGGTSQLHWVEELDWKAYAVVFRLHEQGHLEQARRALDPRRFEAALGGLRRGDFSWLAPVFDETAGPAPGTSWIEHWWTGGCFADHASEAAEALSCACFLGRVSVARTLLAHGIDPAGGMATGLNALHWAANRGELAAVRLLLEHGAPLEARNRYGGTALGTTAWSAVHEPKPDHPAIVETLLAAGADPAEAGEPTGIDTIDRLVRRFRGP